MSNDPSEAPRLYGHYTGIVANRDDPEKRGRLRLIIPHLAPGRIHPAWALPIGMQLGPGEGSLLVPPNDTAVVVVFLDGDPDAPLWMHAPLPQNHRIGHADAYGRERVFYSSRRGALVCESMNGEVELAAANCVSATTNGHHLDLHTGPGGKVRINQPSPDHEAARKGDPTRSGTLTITFNPGTGGAALGISYTDETGITTTLAPTGGSITFEGKIVGGSGSVLIGN